MVSKGRLAGFIDAIIAVVMTIMLLEFELPKTGGIIEFLRDNLVYLIAYLLSFIYVTTSWFNQQYMLQQAETLAVGFTTVACSGALRPCSRCPSRTPCLKSLYCCSGYLRNYW